MTNYTLKLDPQETDGLIGLRLHWDSDNNTLVGYIYPYEGEPVAVIVAPDE